VKCYVLDRASSYWVLNSEARFQTQIGPRGICGSQSGFEIGFSPSSLVLDCV